MNLMKKTLNFAASTGWHKALVWGTCSPLQKLKSRHVTRLSIVTNFALNMARQVNRKSCLEPTTEPRKPAK